MIWTCWILLWKLVKWSWSLVVNAISAVDHSDDCQRRMQEYPLECMVKAPAAVPLRVCMGVVDSSGPLLGIRFRGMIIGPGTWQSILAWSLASRSLHPILAWWFLRVGPAVVMDMWWLLITELDTRPYMPTFLGSLQAVDRVLSRARRLDWVEIPETQPELTYTLRFDSREDL